MPPKWRTQMRETMGSLRSNIPCIVCCGKNKQLRTKHQHLSTAHYNKEMAKLGETSPMCYFCDKFHPINHMSRVKVILTTSTLNGVQFTEGWGWEDTQPTHVDVESIAGAKIETLRRAWERAYGRNPLPIDTLLVAGLNDLNYLSKLERIRRGRDADLAEPVSEAIMVHIRLLHTLIMEHATKHQVVNTFAVSTILHTPSMYWYEADGDVPTCTPAYINLKPVVDRTNLKIREFNLLNGISAAPKLHGSGDRKRGKNKRGYQFSHWREEKQEDMLHLKDPQRMQMMMACVNYMQKATPPAHQTQE